MATTDVALELLVTIGDTDTTPDEICPVCPHPVRSHDAISSRFCAATTAGAYERACVCPSASAS